jgi:signal transduction histidine kinase
MAAGVSPGDTGISMFPLRITRLNIFRILTAGFGLVILLLLAAAYVGVRNIRSIQQGAASLVREQTVTNRLIDELRRQQTSLSEVFSILARDPDSVDYGRIMIQLDEAEADIMRVSAEGGKTPESELWDRLRRRSEDFSNEARRLLSVEEPVTFASLDLFRYHEAFTAVAARLIERQYRQVSAAQAQIDARSRALLRQSAWFASGCLLLALLCAACTAWLVGRLTGALESQGAELTRVSWQMMEKQEDAARRFSHELHDELGQSLTAVKTNLTALDANGLGAHPRLADCLQLVDEAIGNVRQMSQLLHPTILDDFGLDAALRWLCEGFAARTQIDARLDSTFTGRLPEELETHLYRIAQEALTNIARHSGATSAGLALTVAAGEVRLAIRDNGRGLSAPRSVLETPFSSGLGMTGMRARARTAGGDLNVTSHPGEGVLIEVRVPVHDETRPNPAG